MVDTLVWFCNNNNFEIIGLYEFKRPSVCDRKVPAGGFSISFAYPGFCLILKDL
jgi:hypothetical protein